MIRTYKEILNGEAGTRSKITGNEEEIYNDFRILIDMIYEHKILLKIFIEAWDEIIKKRGIK